MATTTGDLDAVIRTVRDYLDGMVYADETRLRRAFHPEARIAGHFMGDLQWLSIDDFLAEVRAAEPIPPGSAYHWRLNSVEFAGDLAVADVEDDFAGVRYTDLLTLIRHEGRWIITHKAFYVQTEGAR